MAEGKEAEGAMGSDKKGSRNMPVPDTKLIPVGEFTPHNTQQQLDRVSIASGF